MNQQTQQEISNLLEQIYRNNDPDTEPDNESQPHTRLNIVIEFEEEEIHPIEEERPTVESTPEEPEAPTTGDQTETPSQTDEENDPFPVPPSKTPPRTRPGRPVILVVLSLVALIGLLIGLGYGFILPLFAPSATITLVTASQQLTTTDTLQLVTNGTADPSKNQVPGRELAAITMSQQKTAATTGTAHQDAKPGHGIITFYNGATYTQTVPAGTALTGADGVQLVTDEDATIPAAIFPTFGQRSIAAHTALPGTGGNVRAGDVYGACCRVNVSAVNGAFTGGQDARTYQTVTPQDINGITTSVTASLEQSVQAAFQTQVQPTETLVTPLDCTQKVTPDHQPGEEATQVHITIDETCKGATYTPQALIDLTAQKAAQDAQHRLGAGYISTGVQNSIAKANPQAHGTIELQIQSVSTWAYQYGAEQEQHIRAMIAGMRQDDAKTTLLHLAAVQSVSIVLSNGATIPTNTKNIHFIFMQM